MAELGADIKDELAVLLLCLANDEVKKVFEDEAAAANVVIDTYTQSIGSEDATIQSLARKVAVAQYRQLGKSKQWWQVAGKYNIWSTGWESKKGAMWTNEGKQEDEQHKKLLGLTVPEFGSKVTITAKEAEAEATIATIATIADEQTSKKGTPSLENSIEFPKQTKANNWINRWWEISRDYCWALQYDTVVWRNGVIIDDSVYHMYPEQQAENKFEWRYVAPYTTKGIWFPKDINARNAKSKYYLPSQHFVEPYSLEGGIKIELVNNFFKMRTDDNIAMFVDSNSLMVYSHDDPEKTIVVRSRDTRKLTLNEIGENMIGAQEDGKIQRDEYDDDYQSIRKKQQS